MSHTITVQTGMRPDEVAQVKKLVRKVRGRRVVIRGRGSGTQLAKSLLSPSQLAEASDYSICPSCGQRNIFLCNICGRCFQCCFCEEFIGG